MIWIGTDSGLFRFSGDRIERIDNGNGVPPIAVHAIQEDGQHRLWVGGSKLLMPQRQYIPRVSTGGRRESEPGQIPRSDTRWNSLGWHDRRPIPDDAGVGFLPPSEGHDEWNGTFSA